MPYSRQPEAAALLLDDGRTVPGVRVESTSFPLTIPASTAAFVVSVALGVADRIVAVAFSTEAVPEDAAPLQRDLGLALHPAHPFALVRAGTTLPDPSGWIAPYLDADQPGTPEAGVRLARDVARRARVPASDFPVGCVGVLPSGRLVGAANVEVDDWTRGLCAERSLVALVAAFGLDAPDTLYLTCLKAACTPCGGCRQVLLDQFAHATLWMDRGAAPPERTTPAALLPGGFAGDGLL